MDGDSGPGEGETDLLWIPSELQFDSPGVSKSTLSVDVFCALVKDCSTGISAKPETMIITAIIIKE